MGFGCHLALTFEQIKIALGCVLRPSCLHMAGPCMLPLPSPTSRTCACFSTQVKAQPPLPSTRLAFLSVLLSLATITVCHGIPFTLIRLIRWLKARRQQQAASIEVQLADESGAPEAGAGKPAGQQKGQQQAPQARHAGKRVQTGLSRRRGGLRTRHPRLFLAVFLASLSIFSALSLTMITIAPSYVDPSIGEHLQTARLLSAVHPPPRRMQLAMQSARRATHRRKPSYRPRCPRIAVQLIQLFSVILIALVQWVAAGLRPPWLMWPAGTLWSCCAAPCCGCCLRFRAVLLCRPCEVCLPTFLQAPAYL